MNNTDSHPRVLSLSSASPNTSNASTPLDSRRASHESAHDAHNFPSAADDKTHKSLNDSIKKLWKGIKQHAVEHHRSVNAAYEAQWSAGARARLGSAV